MTIKEKMEALRRINKAQEEINRYESKIHKLITDNEYYEKIKAAEVKTYGHPLSDSERFDRLEREEHDKCLYRNGMIDLLAALGLRVELVFDDKEYPSGKWDFVERQW